MGHLVDGDAAAALNLTNLLAVFGCGDRTLCRIPCHGPFDDRRDTRRQSLRPQVRYGLRADSQELAITCSPLRRSNAAWPVNAQNSVPPDEYVSDAVVGDAPSSTSGAVNAGEPVITPVAVSNPPTILAIPKSVNCGSP